jgi:hypothetical protein
MSYVRFLPFLVTLAVAGCSLPAPYQTYSPGTAPAPMRRAQVGLTVYGPTNTNPDNLYDPDMQDSVPAPDATFAPAPAAAPAPAPTPTPSQRIAICYNRLWNSADAVRSAATQACGGKSAAHVDNQGLDLDACPLMTPTQAVFTCGGGGP